MEEKNKNIIIPTIIMVITFFVLIVGATYAFFNVSTTTNGASSTININTETVGISSLKTGNSLSLKLTLADMMNKGTDVTYYATSDGTPSTVENSEVIGTSTVEGNGVMDCSYELEANISGTNNLYTAFQNMSTKSTDQLILNVAGIDYDLYSVTFPLVISGTLKNVKEDSPKNIEASFRIVNKYNVDQSAIAGTDIELNFTVNEYNCVIVG